MNNHRIYILLKLIINLLARLPRNMLQFMSDLLGLIWYSIDKRHRTVVLENIGSAYPGRYTKEQSERFAKKVFKNTAGILFEVIWSYRKTKDELFEHFTIIGAQYLKAAQEKGRGVILLTCHLGNFELFITSLAKAGIKPYGIYRKLDFEPLEQLLLEERQRFGAQMIPLRGASRKIDSILRTGGVVGTLLDQSVDWYNGTWVDYFGRPACTNKGLAKLVLRTNASVVPMSIVKKNGQYIMEFLPEIPLQVTGDSIKDIENNTRNYVKAIELMVRKCPEQYFWVHNRWKTKPYSMLPQK